MRSRWRTVATVYKQAGAVHDGKLKEFEQLERKAKSVLTRPCNSPSTIRFTDEDCGEQGKEDGDVGDEFERIRISCGIQKENFGC